ncbi:hypothetical protein [Ferruginibacter sp. SUN106]|uniref:hypothetical protein n=1 Tax=Ferruginibacter sp. SUN106 TaxID=2978348 RepID=UPI003D35BC97
MATKKKKAKAKKNVTVVKNDSTVKSLLRGGTPVASADVATPVAGKPTTVTVTFTAGIGNLTATLFKHLTGAIIGHDSVNTSGTIIFNNANTGDAISINGGCTGTVVINVDVSTDPATPVKFSAGNINFGFDIL